MKRNRGWISTATAKVATIRDLENFPLAKRGCAWPSGEVHNEELGLPVHWFGRLTGAALTPRNVVPIADSAPREGVS